MHLFYFKKDFSLPFYDQVSLREHYRFLPWNRTIYIIQTPLVFDNVAFSFFYFYYKLKKFYMNFDRSKEKGEKTNQSNPKATVKHQNTQTKQFTRNPKGSFVGQFSVQMCIV